MNIKQLKQLAHDYPNDYDFGKIVRREINNLNNKKQKKEPLPINLKCKSCMYGNLKYTGAALYSDPLQYEYVCTSCGKKTYLTIDSDGDILWV